MNANISTADLYDKYESKLSVATPIFRDFGNKKFFSGRIVTVRCFEDNSFVKMTLNELGEGKVLVVDGGASVRCALLGDMLAENAVKNGWDGIVVNGCVRDTKVLATLDLGVKALAACPVRSIKQNIGNRDIAVTFADTVFVPGEYIYADEDGIIVSQESLAI